MELLGATNALTVWREGLEIEETLIITTGITAVVRTEKRVTTGTVSVVRTESKGESNGACHTHASPTLPRNPPQREGWQCRLRRRASYLPEKVRTNRCFNERWNTTWRGGAKAGIETYLGALVCQSVSLESFELITRRTNDSTTSSILQECG